MKQHQVKYLENIAIRYAKVNGVITKKQYKVTTNRSTNEKEWNHVGSKVEKALVKKARSMHISRTR